MTVMKCGLNNDGLLQAEDQTQAADISGRAAHEKAGNIFR
jgi:hypothetical protein